MKAQIKWIEACSFLGHSGSGHSVIMDGPAESGGQNLGIRPMEMLLLGMGGCTAFDVVQILKKSRQSITDCTVEISAQRAESDPKVFTHIHAHFKIFGYQLTEHHVARAIKLSSEKYCSASIMLGKIATISHDYKIIHVDTNQEK
ncbi:OsmC family protein [Candidatus Nitrosacidococcus sp. I8]|uniref:OsmC family protein n=1 Tax=Candidatus Nitrosacidococcus sp. I8 TaxID=2942908 RepID=UPI002227788C|nr:OsmC family protein [Candidatus Nitrosacidococcus sp. I8]CAH9018961.1 Protein YhfA [Candidatus Nitrosacidococcus sp. I8]